MEINWYVLAAIIVVVAVLVFFLIKRNKKDLKEVEKELNFIKKPEETEINNDHNL